MHLLKYLCRKEPFLVVLNYHNFSKYNNYKVNRGNILETGYDKNFEKQVKWLNKHFYFLYPNEFFKNKSRNGVNVLLTFDDGYKDNFDLAFPILKKNQTKSVFFIVSSLPNSPKWLFHDILRFLVIENKLESKVAEDALRKLNIGISIGDELKEEVNQQLNTLPNHRLMMNWDEIKHMSNNGFVIGSHTHTHSPLKFLSQAKRHDEMNESVKTLSSNLNIPVHHFAYPNGLYDDNCHSLMMKYGIDYAYTTKNGFNSINDSPLEIKRIGVNASDSIGVVLLKLLLNFRK